MKSKNNWELKSLDELGFVGRGKSRHRPRNEPALYGGHYPFIQTAEIRASDLYITKYTQTYSEVGFAQSKMWDTGTLCITNAGENTGESAILGFKSCFPDSIIAFIADTQKADVRFVKYFLDTIKPRIKSITKGATQDNLSVDKLLSFKMPTPPLDTQRKIASVLSSYNDLVHNSQRRIQILEETLDLFFKKWFVEFRIPNREITLIETPIGDIPSEWNMASLKNFAEFIRGIEPGSKNYIEDPSDSTVPFLRVGDLGSRKWGVYILKELSQGKLLEKTDIAITLDGTAGIVRVGLEGCYSTGIRKVAINNNTEAITWGFLYCLLKSRYIQDVIKAHAKGTTILHAGSSIDYMSFPLPPRDVIGKFESLAEPILKYIINLQERIVNLRQTRDLLLPKLISGEVDVEGLDINTGKLYAEA